MLLISNNVAFLISNFQLMETFCCSNLPAWGSPQSLRPCPHPHRPQDTQDLLWALSRMPQQGSMLRNNLIYVRDSRGRSGIMASANVSWLKYFWVLKPPSYSRKIKIKGRVFLKKWANPGLFFVYFRSFQTNNFYNKYMWKMSIQYMVPRFEPTTFGTQVSSHNH